MVIFSLLSKIKVLQRLEGVRIGEVNSQVVSGVIPDFLNLLGDLLWNLSHLVYYLVLLNFNYFDYLHQALFPLALPFVLWLPVFIHQVLQLDLGDTYEYVLRYCEIIQDLLHLRLQWYWLPGYVKFFIILAVVNRINLEDMLGV